MRPNVVVGAVGAVLLVLVSAGAESGLAAQSRPLRNGFWFGAGGGYGRLDEDCPVFACEARAVGVASIRLGGTLSDHMLLGFELTSTLHSGGPVAVAAATAYVYPQPQMGLHFKLGAGPAVINLDDEGGLGFAVGAGYDHRIARNISVVPSVSWFGVFDGKASVLHAGLGITFH